MNQNLKKLLFAILVFAILEIVWWLLMSAFAGIINPACWSFDRAIGYAWISVVTFIISLLLTYGEDA